MLKHRIAQLLEEAVREAQGRGVLPALGLPEIVVEYPPNAEYGDYASSLALRLARASKLEPQALAQALAQLVPPAPEVAQVSVVAPGYINFRLRDAWLAQQVNQILALGDKFGHLSLGQGQRVQLEFVSVNPTGPLHVGHGRGAMLGSALARVLEASGFSVEREYYINDAGSQMVAFYRSCYARYLQALGKEAAMPEEGYLGEYLADLGREIAAELGEEPLSLSEEEAVLRVGRLGVEKLLSSIQKDLEALGVVFDVWFSEKSLLEGSQFQQALALLRQGGYIEEKEGALWFGSTALGDSRDNVIIRSSGVPTYFATDIAYHYNKFLERNFDRVINIWGADHQGHLTRMKAAVAALGINPERLQILISQMVTLRRGEEVVKVSKRSGELITLREVMDEVGSDACRFFFLSRSADSQMDFDLELAKKESPDNPVYYVQYAHARIASILLNAQSRGLDPAQGEVALLTSSPELALIRKMFRFPEVVETVALSLEPQHLPYYALDLATTFHSFYKQCRVISSNQALSCARLKLVKAAQIVLAQALSLMGMSAPERM